MRWFALGVVGLGIAGCQTATTKDGGGSLDTIPSDAATTDADTDADADSDADTDADTDADVDTTTTDTATTTTTCANSVVAGFPANGSTDVYIGTTVWFTLAIAEPTATVTVEDLYGNVVTGATDVVGTQVTWSGDPLLPLTTYTATVDYGCGSDATTFTTSDVGDPLALDPTGLVYQIDLGTGIWVEPPGFGTLLTSLLAGSDLLFTPTVIGSSTIDLLGAYGTGGVQDLCQPTIEFPGLAWSDPTVDLVAPAVSADLGGVIVDVTDVDVSGSFASDGSRVQFGRLHGVIDTRNLGSLLGLGTAPDAVCVLLSAFGVGCDPCNDGYAYCVPVAVDDLEAPQIGGTLVPRSQADVAADPACP